MEKTKLKYTFHNPNTQEETVRYISEIFIGVNKNKLERVLGEIAKQKL